MITNATKELNAAIKEFTGQRTVKEAKIELGRLLALSFSAAYDPDGLYCIDVHERWEVVLDKRGYTVIYKDDPWSAMVPSRAYELVKNPATLMLRAGGLEAFHKGWGDTIFHKRVILMPWINPNDVTLLIEQAVDAYVNGEAKAMYSTEERSRLKPTKYTDGGNKLVIDTGHATFDKQTCSIGPGNYWSDTMHGNFIRPYQETMCNGYHFEPGALQKSDLEYYRDIGTPQHILEIVKSTARDKDVILYALFHWYHNASQHRDVRVVHGYILTDADYRLIQSWNTGPSWKSWLVVNGCLPYLAWSESEEQ